MLSSTKTIIAAILTVSYAWGGSPKAPGPVKGASVTVNVTSFGALCDGSRDDTAALKKALASMAQRGGTVQIPSGTCMVSSPIILPGNTQLVGASMGSSAISATPGFPANSAVIYMGDPMVTDTALCFSSIQNLAVLANGSPGSMGIYSSLMQEGSFIDSVGVYGFDKYGIDLDGYGVQNSFARNLYLWPAQGSNNAIGIRLNAAQSRMAIEKVTIYSTDGALQTSPAILLENYSAAAIRDVHCEQFAQCIKVDSNSSALIENVWGNQTVPTIIQFTKTSDGGVVQFVMSGDSPVLVDDQLHSARVAGKNFMASYTASR